MSATVVATIKDVADTATRTPRSTPLAKRDSDRLRELTRKIRMGQRAQTDRIALCRELKDDGVSYDALAAACGVNREAIARNLTGRRNRSR